LIALGSGSSDGRAGGMGFSFPDSTVRMILAGNRRASQRATRGCSSLLGDAEPSHDGIGFDCCGAVRWSSTPAVSRVVFQASSACGDLWFQCRCCPACSFSSLQVQPARGLTFGTGEASAVPVKLPRPFPEDPRPFALRLRYRSGCGCFVRRAVRPR
jgi:hypothetical protein